MGAAGLGAKVALIERHLLGGDCLNVGCVPSKALIRAGRAAHDARRLAAFGGPALDVVMDFAAIMERMRRLRADIAHNDAAARFAAAGIDVFLGDAHFTGPDTIEVAGQSLRFARAVVATGARAAIPEIPGLVDAQPLTNETIFSLTTLPARLAVIGGGPVGCELAQAFARFGSAVTVLAKDDRLIAKDDPDAAIVLARALTADGVTLALGATIERVTRLADGTRELEYRSRNAPGDVVRVVVDEVLVAAGRTPNIDGLGLAEAGVETSRDGVVVDDFMRTTNRNVYAAGDVASPFKFTHAADAMARIVIHNALFFGRKRHSALVVPWSTYTDPEVAHVGISAKDAAARDDVDTLTVELATLDRAILDGETNGFARLHLGPRGKILGATIVARHGGELIGELALAMTAGLTVSALANTIHPYPTQSEIWKRLGDAAGKRRLTPFIKRLFQRLMAWRR